MYLLYSFWPSSVGSSDQGLRYRNHRIQGDLRWLASLPLQVFCVCNQLSISFYSLNLSKISFFMILAFTFRLRLSLATDAPPQPSSASIPLSLTFVFRGMLISSSLLQSISTFVLLVLVFVIQVSSSLGPPSLLYTAQAARVPSVSELLGSILASAFFWNLFLLGFE